MVLEQGSGMTSSTVANLPAGLRGMLAELAAADGAASQGWLLSLLQRDGPGVVAVLWRMLGREQDVLDVYQSVVCRLASRGAGRMGSDRGAYFYRSAINAAIELVRRRRREASRRSTAAEYARRSPLDESGATLEHLRLVERTRHAVLGLPPHLRDVIILHDLAGLNYQRVASILNITSGTARVYRRQAIVRLSVKLSKEES